MAQAPQNNKIADAHANVGGAVDLLVIGLELLDRAVQHLKIMNEETPNNGGALFKITVVQRPTAAFDAVRILSVGYLGAGIDAKKT